MNALEINQLQKTYANGKVALKGIDLTVSAGDFFALLGPNGAGKSTTIGIVSSLVKKSSGDISIFGLDFDTNQYDAKAKLGIVPQEINFSLFENCLNIVLNQAGYYGINRKLAYQRAEKYLTLLGLWDKRFDQSRTLSGGLKRRLMIARALIHEPEMLILDEPTAGVDVELRRSMWQFLRDINGKGTTILLTTHYLEEAESLCRSIAIIDNGEIIENTSMKQVLDQLHVETFVLELVNSVETLPDTSDFVLRLNDPQTIEVDLSKDQNVNQLFDVLNTHNISVKCMRNKSNRLEELFIRLLNSESEGSDGRVSHED